MDGFIIEGTSTWERNTRRNRRTRRVTLLVAHALLSGWRS